MLRHKFRAKPTTIEDIKFPSKAEAKRYLELKALQNLGEVVFFLRQVPFHLTGGVKYVCDFLVFWKDESVTIEDVKGMKTPMYKTKKKMVEAVYPINITEI
jgi:hypothetical protein